MQDNTAPQGSDWYWIPRKQANSADWSSTASQCVSTLPQNPHLHTLLLKEQNPPFGVSTPPCARTQPPRHRHRPSAAAAASTRVRADSRRRASCHSNASADDRRVSGAIRMACTGLSSRWRERDVPEAVASRLPRGRRMLFKSGWCAEPARASRTRMTGRSVSDRDSQKAGTWSSLGGQVSYCAALLPFSVRTTTGRDYLRFRIVAKCRTSTAASPDVDRHCNMKLLSAPRHMSGMPPFPYFHLSTQRGRKTT